MFNQAGDALVAGMGLKKPQVALLIRVGWVLTVSFHIAWVCGWLTFLGLGTPFARAADVDKMQRASMVSARIALNDEIRVQKLVWCDTKHNYEVRNYAYRQIQKLRIELEEITGEPTPEPVCPSPTSASN